MSDEEQEVRRIESLLGKWDDEAVVTMEDIARWYVGTVLPLKQALEKKDQVLQELKQWIEGDDINSTECTYGSNPEGSCSACSMYERKINLIESALNDRTVPLAINRCRKCRGTTTVNENVATEMFRIDCLKCSNASTWQSTERNAILDWNEANPK